MRHRALEEYIFPSEDNAALVLLPELRQLILDYWMPTAYHSYLNEWAITHEVDDNGQPYWYEIAGVSILLVKSSYPGVPCNCCLEHWQAFDTDVKCAVQPINQHTDLILNIAVMVAEKAGKNLYFKQYFIPRECIATYTVVLDNGTGMSIKLNISTLLTEHIKKADDISIAKVGDMHAYIFKARKLAQLLKDNPGQ